MRSRSFITGTGNKLLFLGVQIELCCPTFHPASIQARVYLNGFALREAGAYLKEFALRDAGVYLNGFALREARV